MPVSDEAGKWSPPHQNRRGTIPDRGVDQGNEVPWHRETLEGFVLRDLTKKQPGIKQTVSLFQTICAELQES
jgi:hypothetical protein